MDRELFETLLGRTPLMAGMDTGARGDLVDRFVAHPFTAGEPILRAGSSGRHLGVVVEGRALVQARREARAFTVETLEAGAVFGEMAFFDGQLSRTADVIGATQGVAALLPFAEYQLLARDAHPAAEVLEKAILDLLAHRIQTTDDQLAALLSASRAGSFFPSLRRWFRSRRA